MLLIPEQIISNDRPGLRGQKVEEAIREGLLAAQSLTEEVLALASPLCARDQWYVLGNWSYFHSSRPTQQDLLRDAPPQWKVTRQRVAQIIGGYEDRLQRCGLQPALLTYIVDLLHNEGGMLPTRAWSKAITRAGLLPTAAVLRVMPAIGKVGMVPRIAFHPEAGIWILEPEVGSSWDELTSWAHELRKFAQSHLRHQGAIPVRELRAFDRFGVAHALEVIAPENMEWTEVAGHLVPCSQGRSRLIRLVTRMLAVAGRPMSVRSLTRGAARPVQRAVRVPEAVVRTVLESHPDFELRGDRVRSARTLNRADELNAMENALVEWIESKGGTVNAGAIVGWLRARGSSIGFGGLLCRAPFLRRLERGLYALRGRRPEYERRSATRADAEPTTLPSVGPVLWLDDDRCSVEYPAHEVRTSGALYLPGELVFATVLAPPTWTCALPGGVSVQLQYVDRRLVGLRTALREHRDWGSFAIRATFDIAAATVQLEVRGAHPSQGEHR